MLSALYYPHIHIEDKKLIRNALLLWDKLEYISPTQYDTIWHTDSNYEEALKLISGPYVPTEIEKESAHEIIIKLAQSNLPDWFFFKPENKDLLYNIYPQKFLGKTWQSLQELNLAGEKRKYVNTSHPFGLAMMSILADCCAGRQKLTVTDESDSYAALTRYLVHNSRGEYNQTSPEYARLVAISMEIINSSSFDIKSLTRYRKNETAHKRRIRHNYLNTIIKYADRLVNQSKSEGDRYEIERQYKQELKDDIAALCEELKFEAKKVVLSKEMAVVVIALAGAIIHPITGSIVAVGSLMKKKVEYTAARKRILENHSGSWLYETKKFKFI
jgi:hypothetical protein